VLRVVRRVSTLWPIVAARSRGLISQMSRTRLNGPQTDRWPIARPAHGLMALGMVCALSACGSAARLSVAEGTGPTPTSPAPRRTLIPTINVVKAKGWAPGAVPSAERITLLRDSDGDGVAELRSPFIVGVASPFGMALVGNQLFVAATSAVRRYPYRAGDVRISDTGTIFTPLPAGPINHHWTKSLIADARGERLFVGVGSNSNVGENGLEHEVGRVSIWEIVIATGADRELATGLRNPVGMAIEPRRGTLWVVVNERDELGSDLVPDYLTSVQDGGFHGWPYRYFGTHVDERVKPARAGRLPDAVVPDYALGPHTASLGLAWFADSARGIEGMYVGQHGSWNRTPRSGYKVIFVPFRDGRPQGTPIDVLTGFVSEGGDAFGRPVGVAVDGRGALLVADDVGNTIWRVEQSR
jgi:glucose/arabinose dehydrogenase